MKQITTFDEFVNYGLLDICIDRLKSNNMNSASNNEKINKLEAIKNKFLDAKTEQFLKT